MTNTKPFLRWLVIGGIALFLIGLLGGIFSPIGRMLGLASFGWGCTSSWGYHSPMMGGFGIMNPFGFLGMLFMGIVPFATLALIAAGVLWLVNTLNKSQSQP